MFRRNLFFRSQQNKVYHALKKPILMVGYGSIGRGTLPLLERHFQFQKDQLTILDPNSEKFPALRERGYKNLLHKPLTSDNYGDILTNIFGKKDPSEGKNGDGADGSVRGVVVNVSVDCGSIDVMRLCRELNVLYIDTVVEPWLGFYFDKTLTSSQRSNYALRETIKEYRKEFQGGTTAMSCCGANPGMVSWMTKEALLVLAKDIAGEKHPALQPATAPKKQLDWANLMKELGVKGVHIAERDTQVAKQRLDSNVFANTWSVDGFVCEGYQPAELGWGTHEKWMPENAKRHDFGCKAAIYMEQPGAGTRVRTWCPTHGPQYGFLVTHNEAISIADYYTVGEGDHPAFRPTCHYAYHPCNDAVLSLHQAFGNGNVIQPEYKVYSEQEIASGVDELGVLLYGHSKNAYWHGSTLSHQQTLDLIPENNATGLQVTSAVLAGLVWALNNPNAGVVEADEMDHKACLDVQKQYLGKVWGRYTDWNPLVSILPSPQNQSMFEPLPRTQMNDPWQFANVLV